MVNQREGPRKRPGVFGKDSKIERFLRKNLIEYTEELIQVRDQRLITDPLRKCLGI